MVVLIFVVIIRCSICSVFNKILPRSNVDTVVRFPKISVSLLLLSVYKKILQFYSPPPFVLCRNDSVEHSGEASHCHKSENLKG